MKNKKCGCKSLISMFLAGILVFGLAVPALATGSGKEDEGLEQSGEKSETVYVKAKADGSVEEITVSNWLKNMETGDVLEDYSTLKEIKNVEGDEEFSQEKDGSILWENHGEDISYEGKSEKELPVSVKISYYLDGQKMSPDQIAGKSGRVKIRFDYENHTSETVKVNGKKVDVQVPFVLLSLLFLDSDVFSNVEVTNGKLLESEGQSIAVGYACPGLADSLKLAEYEPTEEVEIPDYVEITADVTEFELEFTATVASTGIFEEMDTEDLDDAEDLADSMKDLQDASAELIDGVGELLDGTKELGSYLDQYSEGVSAVNEGAQKLREGLGTLNSKKSQLETGASALQKGIESLNTALSQVEIPSGDNKDNTAGMEGALNAAAALESDGKALASGLAKLQGSMEQMQNFAAAAAEYQIQMENRVSDAKSKLDAVKLSDVENKANEKAKDQAGKAVDAAVASLEGELSSLDPEQAQRIREQLGNVKAQVVGSIDVTGAASESGAAAAIQEVRNLFGEMPTLEIPSLTVDVSEIQTAVEDMQKQLQILGAYGQMMTKLTGNLSGLSDALNQLKSGMGQLQSGSQKLTEGIKVYNQGIEQVYTGTVSLSEGTAALASAGGALGEGFGALQEGTEALKDGFETFDEEGIQELAKLGGDDLKEVLTRVKAVKKADEGYDNFSGIKEGSKGDVKFIIETEKIEK